MLSFKEFIIESYLNSSKAPLYHITTASKLIDIFDSNTLNIGIIKHPTEKGDLEILSLTRDLSLDIPHIDRDVIICLDKDKLSHNYKFIPYDFFIHTNKEIHKKWEKDRINPFESEEISHKNIKNLNKYIIYIEFESLEFYKKYYEKKLIDYINKYNIDIRFKN
jgi:hypothetical protein